MCRTSPVRASHACTLLKAPTSEASPAPFLNTSPLNHRAGSSKGAGGEGSAAGFDSPERSAALGLENGELGAAGAASPIGDGSETAGDRYQRPLTQRRRGGEAELAAVGVE